MNSRFCGSVASGVRSSGRGTRMFPLTLAADLVSRRVDAEIAALPHGNGQRGAVVVLAGRPNTADLEEGAGAQDAVVVSPEEVAVDPLRRGGRHVHRAGGAAAELTAEVSSLGVKFTNDSGGRSDALVQLLEDVVIDELDLDVFVAAALAPGNVHFAEQIEFGAGVLVRLFRRRGRLVGVGGCRIVRDRFLRRLGR